MLQIYPKLSQSYYSLLEVLLQDHINYVSTLDLEVSINWISCNLVLNYLFH